MSKYDTFIDSEDSAKITGRGKNSEQKVPFSIRVTPTFKDRIKRGAFIMNMNVAEVAEEALALWEEKYQEKLKMGV